MDPEVFFPEAGDTAAMGYAQSVCARCPARTECLEEALSDPRAVGVWGGTGEHRRSRLRAARRRAS